MSFIDTRTLSLSSDFKILIMDFLLKIFEVQPTNIYAFALIYFKNIFNLRPFNEDICHLETLNSMFRRDTTSFDNNEDTLFNRSKKSRRFGVASESLIPDNSETRKISIGQAFEKNYYQKDILKDLISKIMILRNCNEEQIEEIIFKMIKLYVVENDIIITEGEDEKFLFLIQSGIFEIYNTGEDGILNHNTTFENQGSFGELALMYNTKKTGTVIAKSNGVLWCLDRLTFKKILIEQTHLQREKSIQFLSVIPLLESLNEIEKQKIADAIIMKNFESNTIIFRQGQIGDYIYFIESGKVAILLENEKGLEQIAILEEGEYFGELSLMTNRPRAATVKTLEYTKVGMLDRNCFERLLGPCLDILQRNALNYNINMKYYFNLQSTQYE